MLRKVVTLFLLFVAFSAFVWCYYFIRSGNDPPKMMEYKILHQWNSAPIDHRPVELRLTKSPGGHLIKLEINAPFFNDPPAPSGHVGQPYDGLWDYEVVEAFFLGDKENYLELEFCPHGQHLVLLLSKVRESFKKELPLKFTSSIDKKANTWQGKALIPSEYFPPNVSRFNAYAIHGSKDKRTYEALYPVPQGKFAEPNFHRIEFFKEIDFRSILPENWSNPPLEYWEGRT